MRKALTFSFAICLLSSLTQAQQIHDLVNQGNLEKISVLLKQDASVVNSIDENGASPLHLAARNGREDIAEHLLMNGARIDARADADVRKKDGGGQTALRLAEELNERMIADLLRGEKEEQ